MDERERTRGDAEVRWARFVSRLLPASPALPHALRSSALHHIRGKMLLLFGTLTAKLLRRGIMMMSFEG